MEEILSNRLNSKTMQLGLTEEEVEQMEQKYRVFSTQFEKDLEEDK